MNHTGRSTVTTMILTAIALGGLAGVASMAIDPAGRSQIATMARGVAVSTGMRREREPQSRDFWTGCGDARAAGTAPIYRGEPGYRAEMDGDGDGIACEPYGG